MALIWTGVHLQTAPRLAYCILSFFFFNSSSALIGGEDLFLRTFPPIKTEEERIQVIREEGLRFNLSLLRSYLMRH